jgi:hypothetical protein
MKTVVEKNGRVLGAAIANLEVFRREAGWRGEVVEGAGTFRVHGVELSLDAIYEE